MKVKTIIYATDFSKTAQNAFKFACEMSKKTGAEIIATHIVTMPSLMVTPEMGSATYQELEKDLIDFNRQKMEDFCSQHTDKKEKHKLHLEIKAHHSAVQGILNLVEEYGADLVVMGSKGENKLQNFFMGSTVREVIQKASCPVVSVPPSAEYKPIERIIYATDFEQEDIAAAFFLAELAKPFDAEIKIVHVSTKEEFDREQKMEWFKELLKDAVTYPKLTFQLLLYNDIYERLNNYITVNDVQLVAMLERKKKSIFDKWFHKDLVLEMEIHTKVPLLSFNEKYLQVSAKAEGIHAENTEHERLMDI